jgi:hypothetical protein
VRQVQLIAQDQAEVCCGAWFLFDRHRSLQYFTSSQTFSHFLRHWNGRLQMMQVFAGRSAGILWRGTKEQRQGSTNVPRYAQALQLPSNSK